MITYLQIGALLLISALIGDWLIQPFKLPKVSNNVKKENISINSEEKKSITEITVANRYYNVNKILFYCYLVVFHAILIYAALKWNNLVGKAIRGFNNLETVALIINLVGILIRIWSRIHLRRLFTFEVGICNSHKLVQDGPYKYLLHPGYTGLMMMMIGICLYFFDLLLFIFIAIPFAFLLKNRVKSEESLLEKEFGDEWRARKENVAKFIPFVI